MIQHLDFGGFQVEIKLAHLNIQTVFKWGGPVAIAGSNPGWTVPGGEIFRCTESRATGRRRRWGGPVEIFRFGSRDRHVGPCVCMRELVGGVSSDIHLGDLLINQQVFSKLGDLES